MPQGQPIVGLPIRRLESTQIFPSIFLKILEKIAWKVFLEIFLETFLEIFLEIFINSDLPISHFSFGLLNPIEQSSFVKFSSITRVPKYFVQLIRCFSEVSITVLNSYFLENYKKILFAQKAQIHLVNCKTFQDLLKFSEIF